MQGFSKILQRMTPGMISRESRCIHCEGRIWKNRSDQIYIVEFIQIERAAEVETDRNKFNFVMHMTDNDSK